MMRFETRVQPNWDVRAACNFMLGGTGGGLLLASAVAAYPELPGLAVLALVLVGLGLFCVWLEIGRPWRFINVFFHLHTSWMSREATVALVTFLLAAAGVYSRSAGIALLGGLSGLAFLFCQGRILQASKGIPVWRERAIVHLMVSTGVCEGVAVLCGVQAVVGDATRVSAALLGVLVLVRAVSWRVYEHRLLAQWLPEGLAGNLAQNRAMVVYAGTLVPLVLLAIDFVLPPAGDAAHSPGWRNLAVLAASVAALAAGWYTKWNLITRASHMQGYALATRVQKGRPKLTPPIVRGGYR
jgi:phenylacetyl-CoA:acceptor oxidoreductase subunit 2